MANFTLDDIRSAADKKYSSTEIELGNGEVAVLLNPLRLRKEKRDQLVALQKQLDSDDDDVDQEKILGDSLLVVAQDQALGKKLVKAIDGDLAMLIDIFTKFSGGTELGEASASQD